MLILLPPSEGKTPATRGEPFAIKDLSFPRLETSREFIHENLKRTSQLPEAAKLLHVGESLLPEIERNVRLEREPASPAHRVYTGVLYDALGYPTLTPRQREKAQADVLVISALWGALRLGDRIPAYRLPMNATLPDLGPLSTWWKPRLAEALAPVAKNQLIIDCRSSTYQQAWSPPAEQTVAVNVFQIRAGKRTVVSHFAKHTRGELARVLLQRRGAGVASPSQLAAAASKHWDVDLIPATAKKPHQLDLTIR